MKMKDIVPGWWGEVLLGGRLVRSEERMEACRYGESTKPVFESRPFDSCLGPRGGIEMDPLVAGKRLCVDGKCGVAAFVKRPLKKWDLDGRSRCGGKV